MSTTKIDAVLPTVSTATAKAQARGITNVAGAQTTILSVLKLIDQIQTTPRGDPRRMRVNGSKESKKQPWYGG